MNIANMASPEEAGSSICDEDASCGEGAAMMSREGRNVTESTVRAREHDNLRIIEGSLAREWMHLDGRYGPGGDVVDPIVKTKIAWV